MNISDLSIKRPIFITCIFILILVVGAMSMLRLGVDLYPNVNFPIVLVTTTYPGAGPAEIESLISKPLEDTLTTISGVKSIRSTNKEGVSSVVVEFTLDTDSKYAEQQVKDRVSTARPRLPDDINEPAIRAFDPADQPILTIALSANKEPADLYDIADIEIKPLIEQVKDVGFVEVIGGRKREIQVLLDRDKLRQRNLSASSVAMQLNTSGKNIPAGKAESNDLESVVRTLGEYDSLKNIRNTLINFFGNEIPVRVGDVADVKEALEDEKSRTYVDGQPALNLMVFRRSGANTIQVVDQVKKRIETLNKEFPSRIDGFKMSIVQDGGKPIEDNVEDVTSAIVEGMVLTILVVFLFLGSFRSTIITGIALPNSLLGAFILMSLAGFTINIMTLLALSLAVGLLIDDAIVVRENIFRHIEMGKTPAEAASQGTKEVTLAVIATTLTVVAVFGPVAFLQGVVGQFFKEFGLTICFAMMISLLDALTMAPMLSAYFAGSMHGPKGAFGKFFDLILKPFNKFQDYLEKIYVSALHKTLRFPLLVLFGALLIFVGSFAALKVVPKTFIPAQDNGEFQVSMLLPAGTDMKKTAAVTKQIDEKIRANKEVRSTVVTIGGRNGEANESGVFVRLVPAKERIITTTNFKEDISKQLKEFEFARPKVQDRGGFGGAQQPLNVNIVGTNMDDLLKTSEALMAKLREHPDLKDVDTSYRAGKPEYRVIVDKEKSEYFGVSTTGVGQELRTQIEGTVAAVFRRDGKEYDIRVRLQDEQKNIKKNFEQTYVPNINQRLVKLSDVANPEEVLGPASIERQDRSRYIQVSAGLKPDGKGLGNAMADIKKILENQEIEIPPGVHYKFVGQAESFQELMFNMLMAAVLAILFIYLVLSSLYESFITPFTIMLVLPLAACGAFYALAITGSSLDMFSMIGCIMLLGVATKNSILLVDYINQQTAEGRDLKEAIIEAGRVRLRPIIMTSLALIAGMLPVAIGLSEASKQRTSMGIAVIGGLISSTILTLVVVPAAYTYIEKFRSFVNRIFSRIATKPDQHA